MNILDNIFGTNTTDDTLTALPVRHGERVSLQKDIQEWTVEKWLILNNHNVEKYRDGIEKSEITGRFMMKQLHLKSIIVGLVFGVMSVVIMNNYFDPIENAFANDCPNMFQIEKVVREVVTNCTFIQTGYYGQINCYNWSLTLNSLLINVEEI